jgi:hypothetical protein
MALEVIQNFIFNPMVDPEELQSQYGIAGSSLIGTNTVGSWAFPFVPSTNPNNPLELTVSDDVLINIFRYYYFQMNNRARNAEEVYLKYDALNNPSMKFLGYDLEWLGSRVRMDSAIPAGTLGFESGRDGLIVWGAANVGHVRANPSGFVYGQTQKMFEESYNEHPAEGGDLGDYVIDKTLDTMEELYLATRRLLNEGFTIPNVYRLGDVKVSPRSDMQVYGYIVPGLKEYYQIIDREISTNPGIGPFSQAWAQARYAVWLSNWDRLTKRYNPVTNQYESRNLKNLFDVWVAEAYPFQKDDRYFSDYIYENMAAVSTYLGHSKKIYAYVGMGYHPSNSCADHVITPNDAAVMQTTLRTLHDEGKIDGYMMWGGYGSGFSENGPVRHILPLASATPVTLQKSMANWRAVTNGAFHLRYLGGYSHIGGTTGKVTGMNFSACNTMNDVATVMQTKINEYLETVPPNLSTSPRSAPNQAPMYSASYPYKIGPVVVTYHTSGVSPSQSTPFFKFTCTFGNEVQRVSPPNHGYYIHNPQITSPTTISGTETDIGTTSWIGTSNYDNLGDVWRFQNVDEFYDGWGLGTDWWDMMVEDATVRLLSEHKPLITSTFLSAGYVLRASFSSDWSKTTIEEWEISLFAPKTQIPEVTTISRSDSVIQWTYAGTLEVGTYYLKARIMDQNKNWSDYSVQNPIVVYIQPPPPPDPGATGSTGGATGSTGGATGSTGGGETGGETGDDGTPIDPPPEGTDTFVIDNSRFQSPGYSNALPPNGRASDGLVLGN